MKIKKLNEMSESDRIPTASEFLREKYNNDFNSFQDNVDNLREFAQMHVEAALKSVHSSMQLPDEDLDYIMDSYPLSNIKY